MTEQSPNDVFHASSFMQGHNAEYLEQLQARWASDPASVDEAWAEFFRQLGDSEMDAKKEAAGPSWARADWPPAPSDDLTAALDGQWPAAAEGKAAGDKIKAKAAEKGIEVSDEAIKQAVLDSVRALMLIRAYRIRGHLAADLDPLGMRDETNHPELDPRSYGFAEADMDRPIFLDQVLGLQIGTMRQIVDIVKRTYCGTFALQYMHISNPEEAGWLKERIEGYGKEIAFTREGRKAILNKLVEAEGFEKFLHVKYMGTKRFGLDGGEALVPAMEQIIKRGGSLGVKEIVIGMPHRGRLSVLANVMSKPYRAIFNEFQGGSFKPEDVDGSGDVKYHLGASSDREFDGNEVHLSLTANPSHLEAVNPVVLGKARAKQDQLNDADRTAVLATAKHFAGYSETQGGRDASEADLSRRKLRSWFLPPFEKAVHAGCRTFMLGYQAIDGVPVTANKWLLNEVLKKEWGFTGTLVTDWDNVGRMVWEQKVYDNDVEAAAVAVEAGNDLVMSTPQFFTAAQQAVTDGRLSEALLDDAVRRILTLKFELGLFEDPRLPDPAKQAAVVGSEEHTALNLHMARRSLVLLRNDGTLPLDGGLTASRGGRATSPARPRTIAVVGPNADDPHAQLGDWAGASGQVPWMPDGHPRHLTTTVLDGFREVAPPNWTITHARGADIGKLIPDPAGETYPDGQPRRPMFLPSPVDPAMMQEALDAAQAADWVVAVLGDVVALTGERRSTATLELQGAQIALLGALATTGKPVIVVLVQSKPSVLPDSALNAAAIIEAFNPGMQGGRAIAELVLGLIEPTGRLPISFARHAGQLPVYYNQVRGQHGDRYADLTQDPLFAFGEGLSYTTVEYSNLRISAETIRPDETLRAVVAVTNSGGRPTIETVQAYISDTVASVTWAERELKAFAQTTLAPGESADVEIAIPAAECSLVDADGRRVVEPGTFELLIGSSSRDRDLLRTTFTIGG